jgi:hypothetical protein
LAPEPQPGPLVRSMTAPLRTARHALLGLACVVAAHSGWAGTLAYCQGQQEPSAAVQDRLIQVAGIVKSELERSGGSMALVARSGLALQRFDQRYSHAGVSLKNSPNTPWSVRQLYYACDERRPRIFDQGISGFVLGANDPAEGYVSIIVLPDAAAHVLEQAALDAQQSLQLLGGSYSANAYAFSQRYQNCNQWLVELMASAWGALAPGADPRGQAQQWLRAQGYVPSTLAVGSRPLMALAALLPWLHSDDHPQEDLAESQFRVSMPESIAAFVHARLPDATRLELCYTTGHVVVHQGWEPIAQGCEPGPADTVIPLLAGPG